MSLSQFHCTSRLYLDMHVLISETSICYWQDQPGRPPCPESGRRPGGGAAGGVAERGACGRGRGAAPRGVARPAGRSRRRALEPAPLLAHSVAGSRACYRRRRSGPAAPAKCGRVAGVATLIGFEKRSFRSAPSVPAARNHLQRRPTDGGMLARPVAGQLG